MNCNYTIKHYWDIQTKSATLEPEWLASGDELSLEKEAIKSLYKKTLGNAIYYNKLIASKIESEMIDDYTIKYIYIEKDDPLSENSRKVTDITMCITLPMKLPSIGLFLSVFFIFLGIGVGYFFLPWNEETPKKQEKPTNNYQIKTKSTLLEKPKQFYICNKEWKAYAIGDNHETACLQDYLTLYCNKKTELTTEKWLADTKSINCIGIDKFNYKSITSEVLKRSKKQKKHVKKFLQGKL